MLAGSESVPDRRLLVRGQMGQIAAELIDKHRRWRCLAAFPVAAYLAAERDQDAVVVLVAAQVPIGPLHVRLGDLTDRPGDRVDPRDTLLGWRGGLDVELEPGANAGQRHWVGEPLPGPVDAHRLHEALGLVALADPLLPQDVADRAIGEWRAGHLDRSLARLLGRGSGLTPSGDDLAAGILLAAVVRGVSGAGRPGVTCGPGELSGVLEHALAGQPTNRISAAYLRAAAAGQSIEPVHRLLHTLVAALPNPESSDSRGLSRAKQNHTTREILAELTSYGATSGSYLAYGLLAALLPP